MRYGVSCSLTAGGTALLLATTSCQAPAGGAPAGRPTVDGAPASAAPANAAPESGTPAPSCATGVPRCDRQVLALQPGSDMAATQAWLLNRGVAIEQRLDAFWTLLIWLPRDAAVRAELRAQPWVRHLDDPVAARPDAR